MGVVDLKDGKASSGEKLRELGEKSIDVEITFGATVEGEFGFEVFDRGVEVVDISGWNIGEIGENKVELDFGETFQKV